MCIKLLINDNVLILSVNINKYIGSIKLHLIVSMGIIFVTIGCCGINTKKWKQQQKNGNNTVVIYNKRIRILQILI